METRSLAIVERQAPQRPVAGCVGVFFLHLFDWNRRLAAKNKNKNKKKKTTTTRRRLLPPLLKRCPKSCSSASPPPPPQLTNSEEGQIDSTTPMQAPGLLARLMGLESMPVSRSGKSQKDPNKQFQPAKGIHTSKDICCSEMRPPKMQKTSSSSSEHIINSCSAHLKEYHHNTSCLSVRSPRVRLIQAATKILEPGLRPRLPVSPLNSSARNIEENVMVGSLHGKNANIGSFSENEMEPMVISRELEKVKFPPTTNVLEETRDLREDASKNIAQVRKCNHIEQKVTNLAVPGCKMEVNHHGQRNHGEQHNLPKNTPLTAFTTGKMVPKAKMTGAKLNKRVTDKPFGSCYLGPEKNLNYTTLKSCTISNSTNLANHRRRTTADLRKKTDVVSFGTRSSNQVFPKREITKKRENSRACSVSSSQIKSVSKKNTINGVKKQTIFGGKERLKVKDYASNLIGSILEDLLSEVSKESGLYLSGGNTSCSNLCEGDKDTSLCLSMGTLDGDQPSPISILEASFSNDSSSLGSPVNQTDCNMLFGSAGTIQKQPDFDYFDISTEETSNSDVQILASKIGRTSEVFSNIELAFCEKRIEQENFSINSFLLDLLKDLLEVFRGSLNGEKEGCPQKNFLFDCIIEFLDQNYGYFYRSYYKGRLVISQSLNRDQLFKDALKELKRWSEMRGKALYVLADNDLGTSIERWSKRSFEGFEIGDEVESAITRMLVDEFVFDLY